MMKSVTRNLARNIYRASPAAKACGPAQSLPASIINSPLMRAGGFEVFQGFMDREGWASMLSEATRLYAAAHVSDVQASDDEEVRGGTPARRFRSVAGGPLQKAFYHSPWMLEFLSVRCNARVSPLGSHGSYSFYSQTGDYLAIHRDIESCDVAVINCLYNGPRRDGYGGALCLYPHRIFEPLSAVRRTPERGAIIISLSPGQTIIMFGGIIPHTLLPTCEGQTRIVSVLCYRASI